ncbi:MAG: anti-sigma factor [Povalibacter sp.]
MNTSWRDDERLVDLLVKEATEGLDADEARELTTLAGHMPAEDRDSLQHAAAAVALAANPAREKMPTALRERIVAAAPAQSDAQDNVVNIDRARGVPRGYSTAGWWAAAACLVLAIAGWWPRLVGEGDTTQPVAANPEHEREQLLASGRALEAAWSPTSEAPIQGDVVFDPVTQRGFLRFRGIPANDPRLAQYQLWIADAGRPQPEPVDGGVFNVTTMENGDVIIPFQAKLPVGKPAAFVVTLEQPGGVVVSKQEKVMALAKVPAGI